MTERRLTWMIASTVFAVLVAVAAVLGPSIRPEASSPDGGSEIAAIDLPAWSAGDTWTYNMTLARAPDGSDPASSGGGLSGTITKTVVGTVNARGGSAYNVSLAADFAGAMDSMMEDDDHIRVTEASVDGYSWYRTADLAKIRDVRTLTLEGETSWMAGTASARLTVWTDASYEPAWDLWAFPIEENESWAVRSNATVDVRSLFRLEAPDHSFEYEKNGSFTIPIAYTMGSGTAETVTTPAGTFEAMRTFVAGPADDHGDVAGILAWIGDEAAYASLEAWFSPDVENVVRVVGTAGGSRPIRIEVALVSFHVG
ncbi:MAG TPA: hypothetical protein VJ326_07865 [Thermoplasmata archaeon]|nr:hypothetical protein [Thermoplasmata archaeon]